MGKVWFYKPNQIFHIKDALTKKNERERERVFFIHKEGEIMFLVKKLNKICFGAKFEFSCTLVVLLLIKKEIYTRLPY